jgi:hypothetical protein
VKIGSELSETRLTVGPVVSATVVVVVVISTVVVVSATVVVVFLLTVDLPKRSRNLR